MVANVPEPASLVRFSAPVAFPFLPVPVVHALASGVNDFPQPPVPAVETVFETALVDAYAVFVDAALSLEQTVSEVALVNQVLAEDHHSMPGHLSLFEFSAVQDFVLLGSVRLPGVQHSGAVGLSFLEIALVQEVAPVHPQLALTVGLVVPLLADVLGVKDL